MDNAIKYVGIVKWFHDQIKDSYYGFINNHELGDLYFSEKSIDKDQNLSGKNKSMGLEQRVRPKEKSAKHDDNIVKTPRLLEAATEFNIGKETIIEFLIDKGFEITNNPNIKLTELMYSALQVEFAHDKLVRSFSIEALHRNSATNIKSHFNLLNNFQENTVVTFYLKENTDNIELKGNSLKELPSIYEYVSHNKEKRPEAINVKLLSSEDDLRFLFETFLSLAIEFKKRGEISRYAVIHKGINIIIDALKIQLDIVATKSKDEQIRKQLLSLYKKHFAEYLLNSIDVHFTFIVELLDIARSYLQEYYQEILRIAEEDLTPELMYELWLEKYSNIFPIDFIAKKLFECESHEKTKIFNTCSVEERRSIFYKIISSIEFNPIDLYPTQFLYFIKIKKLLNLAKEYAFEDYERISTAAINICPDYFKLELWLEDYPAKLDFNVFKLFIIALSPSDQKKFVKKVLKNIHEGLINIKVEEFTSINTIDYETSKLAANLDNSHLDYSTSIILNLIAELQKQTAIDTRQAQGKIYDLIIKQIKEPDDILQITGYFDECQGRCKVSVKEEKNELNETVKIIDYKRGEKARRHPICDGRKAINSQNNLPILSEDNNQEFWWCANHQCYQPSRSLHSSDNWMNYTLLDFLTILNVGFKEQDLEIYLSLINKANHFLTHLKCRKCNQILRPVGQSNYAFYRVTRFHCLNNVCEEKGKEIYLNHCLNGYCEDVIDSRDSVRCKPDGYDEKCGWYVCNNCFACCSSEGIGRRKNNLERMGQEYKCHAKGHRDLGILCCNKCGNPMMNKEIDIVKYQETLSWFIENRIRNPHIINSGQNRKGKWWFRFDQDRLTGDHFKQKVQHLFNLGFRIPDFDVEKSTYLICERSDNTTEQLFFCKSCNNIVDLSNDYERLLTIKKYHKHHFTEAET